MIPRTRSTATTVSPPRRISSRPVRIGASGFLSSCASIARNSSFRALASRSCSSARARSMASQVRSAVSLMSSTSSGVQARGETVAHAQRRDQSTVPDQRRGNERTHVDRGDGRTIRVGNQRRGPDVGDDHRPAHSKCRADPIEIGQRISSDPARDPGAHEVLFDPDVALRFVYLCVVGTVCQQPLAEKPAGLSLNRHRIDQQPQGIAKPEKKRVP